MLRAKTVTATDAGSAPVLGCGLARPRAKRLPVTSPSVLSTSPVLLRRTGPSHMSYTSHSTRYNRILTRPAYSPSPTQTKQYKPKQIKTNILPPRGGEVCQRDPNAVSGPGAVTFPPPYCTLMYPYVS